MNIQSSFHSIRRSFHLAQEIRHYIEPGSDIPEQLIPLVDTFNKIYNIAVELRQFLSRHRDLLKQLSDSQQSLENLLENLRTNIGERSIPRRRKISEETADVFEKVILRHKSPLAELFECVNYYSTLTTGKDDENQKTILKSIILVDYTPQQHDYISQRQKGTGQWLLAKNQFREWVSQSGKTLFCPGIPGAGKTVLTAIVVDELQINFQKSLNVGIAYVYCDYRRQCQQKPVHLLASLLGQLNQKFLSVPHQKHQEQRGWAGTSSALKLITRRLLFIVRKFSRVFIVVDGLDECQNSCGERKELLTELFDLQDKGRVNLFITSRFNPEIKFFLDGRSTQLEIRAQDEDLQTYLDNTHSLSPVLQSSDSWIDIKSEMIVASDGRFLLAQLYLNYLSKKPSLKGMKGGLNSFTKGSGTYDSVYHEAMEWIESQAPDFKILAKKTLSWVICARRYLTPQELQYALAVKVNSRNFENANLISIEDIVSACAGLITVDENSNVIRLVSLTAQEFFEQHHKIQLQEMQKEIADVCVTYLSYDKFESGFCTTDHEFEGRLCSSPLYAYAAQNWGYHIHDSSFHSVKARFMQHKAKLSAASQALMVTRTYRYDGYSQDVPMSVAGIHLAAYFGLEKMLESLIQNQESVNLQDSRAQTPLLYASRAGHEAVVRLLLMQKEIEVGLKDELGRTPLTYAAQNGYDSVMKLLLTHDKLDVDEYDFLNRRPLSYAAENGHEVIVQMLLAKTETSQVHWEDLVERSALSYAAKNGHEVIVQMLLAKTEKVHWEDLVERSALSYAAENGYEKIVKILLFNAEKFDIHQKDLKRRTPLSYAAENGHENVVKKLLINANIHDIHQKDLKRRIPLSYAAENGHENVVRLLLIDAHIYDTSLKDLERRTALSYAAENGHENVVRLLINVGIYDISLEDLEKRTPLSYAAEYGHENVVKLLIDADIYDVSLKDLKKRTPLSYAAENGHENVVKLLIDANFYDIYQEDLKRRTPLSYAAENGHENVVRLLLIDAHTYDISLEDLERRTALSYVVMDGHENVVKLLLKRPDIKIKNLKDHDGRTPLFWAIQNSHEGIVRLLLEMLSDFDTDGSEYLDAALATGSSEIVQLLLQEHMDWVAQGEKFQWLHSLTDASLEISDIMTLLFETARQGPWLPYERPYIDMSNASLSVDFHQMPCAHEERPIIDVPYSLPDPVMLHNKRDLVQQGVIAHCGLAGLHPILEGGKPDFGNVQFDGLLASISFTFELEKSGIEAYDPTLEENACAEIISGSASSTETSHSTTDTSSRFTIDTSSYSATDTSSLRMKPAPNYAFGLIDSEMLAPSAPLTKRNPNKREIETDDPRTIWPPPDVPFVPIRQRVPPPPSLLSARSSGRSPLSQDQISGPLEKFGRVDLALKMKMNTDLIDHMHKGLRGLIMAMALLQRNGFCCDRFTVLTIPEQSIEAQEFPTVKMSSITLRCIIDLESSMGLAKNYGPNSAAFSRCFIISTDILDKLFGGQRSLMAAKKKVLALQSPTGPEVDQQLHICSLTLQILSLALAFYAQGHTGEFYPVFLKDPLSHINLEGTLIHQTTITAGPQELACMGSMIGGKVFVFRTVSPGALDTPDQDMKYYLSASCEDIIDTWGPGYLIKDPNEPSTGKGHGVGIGGGVISLSHHSNQKDRHFHWSREVTDLSSGAEPFNYKETILVGAITVNNACPLNIAKSRVLSEGFLENLGSEPDTWVQNQRQVMLQGGNFVLAQIGLSYQKQIGRNLKAVLLNEWQTFEDVRLFDLPWGLQVSLCTGVARRVRLRDLIEDPLLNFIDTLNVRGWAELKRKDLSAIKNDNFLQWFNGLNNEEKTSIKTVFGKLLQLFAKTGFDESGDRFCILWPHEHNPHFGIKIHLERMPLWYRMLKDTECCATFAVLTSHCLETPKHRCKMKNEVQWHGGGTLFSTAVCQRLTEPSVSRNPSLTNWELKHKEQYWIGKSGGDVWVRVRKEANSNAELQVLRKYHNFPSYLFRNRILREKPDAAFDAETVTVYSEKK